MKSVKQNKRYSGAVLLVILFVVMAVTVLSMAFMSNAHMQMTCGKNLVDHTRIDYLAEAGLVHAKTLLLHPQNAATGGDGYWQGGAGLQVEAGDDYYDLTVTRSISGPTARCTYDIECRAYRLDGADRTVRGSLAAQLRLDPCIAYWAGAAAGLPAAVTINGDVYCAAALNSTAAINGDVFAASFTGTSTGQTYAPAQVGVAFPGVTTAFFSPVYNYGGLFYLPRAVTPADCNNPPAPFVPDGANPAGILYYDKALHGGNALALVGDVTITGTLVVDGDLTMRDGAVTISPVKNYPALVVNGNLTIQNAAQLNASGLMRVNTMTVAQTAGNITLLGALFVKDAGVAVDGGYAGDVTVTADPMRSALYSSSMIPPEWSPAADAFFKYVKRIP